MLRRTLLPTLVLLHLVAAGSACDQKRLPPSDGERACRSLVRCWYPEEGVTAFDHDSARWGSMANPTNAQNIRHAYGESGSCWYADPMSGTVSDGEEVEDDSLAVGCGASCACAILELCFAREDAEDPAPPCVNQGAASDGDPCEDDRYPAGYAALCPACQVEAPPDYCAGLTE